MCPKACLGSSPRELTGREAFAKPSRVVDALHVFTSPVICEFMPEEAIKDAVPPCESRVGKWLPALVPREVPRLASASSELKLPGKDTAGSKPSNP